MPFDRASSTRDNGLERVCRLNAPTSFPGSTPLSRWRGGEDPGRHRYDTHADWSEDIDILTLVVIGRNCLPYFAGGITVCARECARVFSEPPS